MCGSPGEVRLARRCDERVCGIIHGVGDVVGSVSAVGSLPVTRRGGIRLDEGSAGRARRWWRRRRWCAGAEEQARDDGVGGRVEVRDAYGDAAGQIPDEVDAVLETAERLAVEHGPGAVINHIHAFAAAALPVVPVCGVESELMRLAVG